jgi:hypothetical protein
MSNIFFIFFEIWARPRLLDVPRLPREKVSARLNFAAPVPIFVTFTRQNSEVPLNGRPLVKEYLRTRTCIRGSQYRPGAHNS